MKRRGMTLVEMVVGLTVMCSVLMACFGMYGWTLQMYRNTSADIEMSNEDALTLRRISETLRSAMSITINETGTKVTYILPKKSTSADSDTGEKEYLYPLVADGVTRSYTVSNGQLTDDLTGKVLVDHVILIDPEPTSSQYNKAYAPFQLTTVGSRRALSLNVICQEKLTSKARYVRFKTTVILRNGP